MTPPINKPIEKTVVFFCRACDLYQRETGQSLNLWVVIALLSFITQIIFRREMAPGEFGTFNTALGVIGLMTLPLLALNQTFTHYLTRNHAADRIEHIESLRAARIFITEIVAWISVAILLPLLFFILPLLGLPRFSLYIFTLFTVYMVLGCLVSGAICETGNRLRLWGWLLIITSIARLLLGAGLAEVKPLAEAGLTAFLLAGFIMQIPIFHQNKTEPVLWQKAWKAVWDREFLLVLGATSSVVMALFLFSSADRIVAQGWFGAPTTNNMGYVNWDQFDGYQTAGLLGRALLWGTQPLLWILFAQRSRLNCTTAASLTFFWIYLGALLVGAILLRLLGQSLCQLFCGNNFQSALSLIPIFSMAMLPLGLLQGLGIFVLASRRLPECFVLGGCSVGYTILLYLAGRQPQLMVAYMFGGGLVALMGVFFVGVVRWGRKQP